MKIEINLDKQYSDKPLWLGLGVALGLVISIFAYSDPVNIEIIGLKRDAAQYHRKWLEDEKFYEKIYKSVLGHANQWQSNYYSQQKELYGKIYELEHKPSTVITPDWNVPTNIIYLTNLTVPSFTISTNTLYYP